MRRELKTFQNKTKLIYINIKDESLTIEKTSTQKNNHHCREMFSPDTHLRKSILSKHENLQGKSKRH